MMPILPMGLLTFLGTIRKGFAVGAFYELGLVATSTIGTHTIPNFKDLERFRTSLFAKAGCAIKSGSTYGFYLGYCPGT